VVADPRIVDGTSEFDDSLYPQAPAAPFIFWGVPGAKFDQTPAEDELCDRDVAALNVKLQAAGASLGEKRGVFKATKHYMYSKSQICPDPGEGQSGAWTKPAECVTSEIRHCAAVLSSASEYRFRYVRAPDRRNDERSCLSDLARESAKPHVLASGINYHGNNLCSVRLLEIYIPRARTAD
jgi:hypothetical protein